MKYDLIIVARSTSKELVRMTENCINSARQDKVDLHVIVVETTPFPVNYDAQIVRYTGELNYNRALNLGLKHVKGDIHILANNDIIFHKDWSLIGESMIVNEFPSASALSTDPRQRGFDRGDWIYPGYEIGIHLTGWCIFVTKELIAKIGKFDESFDFWYSDNVYANQLIAAGIIHGLFCNVQVDHITSVTLRTLTLREQRRYSQDASHKYKSLKMIRHAG